MLAEAGRAGVGPCIVGAQNNEFCLSNTGAVTAIAAGRQVRVATGLLSLGLRDGGEVFGPHDVALTPGGTVVSIGLGTDPAKRAALGPSGKLIGQVVRLTHASPRAYADLAGYEGANDPDGGPRVYRRRRPVRGADRGAGVAAA